MRLSRRLPVLCLAAALLAPAGAGAYPVDDAGAPIPASVPKKHGKKQKQGKERQGKPQVTHRRARSRPRRQAVHPRRTARPAPRRRTSRHRSHRRRAPRPSAPAITPGLSQFRTPPEPPRREVREERAKPPRRERLRRRSGEHRDPPARRRHPAPPPPRDGQPPETRHERAVSYLDTRTTLAALPFGLGGPLVSVLDLTAGRGVRREAHRVERRREQRALTRSRARTYLRARETISNGDGRKTPAIARYLATGQDAEVRRAARRLVKRRRERRRERRLERLERVHERVFAPLEGPALEDYDGPVGLPFPGGFLSTTLGCERQVHPTGAFSCLGIGRRETPVSAGVSAEVTETHDRGETLLHPDGQSYQTIGMSTDVRLTGSGRAQRGRYGIEFRHLIGRELSYSATVSPERAESIADGGEDPPNPVDPRSLEEGESLEMSREDYQGNGQRANYRLLQLQLGHTDGRRVSSGVQHLEDDQVRIYVGDEQVVENALALGVGNDDFGAAVGLSNEYADGRLRTTDLDVSSRRGWNRYQAFITTGRLPSSPGRGVVDSTTSGTFDWSGDRTLEARIGPVTLGGTWKPFDGSVTNTLHMNGRRERTMTYRDGEITTVRSMTHRPGRHWRAGRLSLMLQDADGDTIAGLLENRGRSAEVDEDQSVMLDFTPAELNAVRHNAIEQLSELSRYGDEPLSEYEVDELMRGNPDAYLPGVVGGGNHYQRALARARNPVEILDALSHGAFRNSDVVAIELFELERLDGDSTAPGRVVVLDD